MFLPVTERRPQPQTSALHALRQAIRPVTLNLAEAAMPFGSNQQLRLALVVGTFEYLSALVLVLVVVAALVIVATGRN